MTGWAHRGHSIRAEPSPAPSIEYPDDDLVVLLLRSARADAGRSPDEISADAARSWRLAQMANGDRRRARLARWRAQ